MELCEQNVVGYTVTSKVVQVSLQAFFFTNVSNEEQVLGNQLIPCNYFVSYFNIPLV